MKYVVFWVLMIVTQVPCNNILFTDSGYCIQNDTLYIENKIEVDSLSNAISFYEHLNYIKARNEIVDTLLLKNISNCPKVFIDTVWTNDFSEVFINNGY